MGINTSGVLYRRHYSGGANVDVCSTEFVQRVRHDLLGEAREGRHLDKSQCHRFSGEPRRRNPNCLILAKGGNMYGTTNTGGGTAGYGTIFEMVPAK